MRREHEPGPAPRPTTQYTGQHMVPRSQLYHSQPSGKAPPLARRPVTHARREQDTRSPRAILAQGLIEAGRLQSALLVL